VGTHEKGICIIPTWRQGRGSMQEGLPRGGDTLARIRRMSRKADQPGGRCFPGNIGIPLVKLLPLEANEPHRTSLGLESKTLLIGRGAVLTLTFFPQQHLKPEAHRATRNSKIKRRKIHIFNGTVDRALLSSLPKLPLTADY
jgi:hypothetical protein